MHEAARGERGLQRTTLAAKSGGPPGHGQNPESFPLRLLPIERKVKPGHAA